MPDEEPSPPDDQIEIDDPLLAAGFTVVPNILFAADVFPAVTLGAKWLYAGLLRYGRGGGRCFPGQACLSRELGLSPASITRHLSELKECGLVVVTRRGKPKTNLYRLPRLEQVLAAQSARAASPSPTPTPARPRGRPRKTPAAETPVDASAPPEDDVLQEAVRKKEASEVWTTVYSACGADIALMTVAAKARAYRKARELLTVFSAPDILGCAAYMTATNGAWWRAHPMTLEAVEKQLRTWIPDGRPTGHERPRARERTTTKKGGARGYDPTPRPDASSPPGEGDSPGESGAHTYALRATEDVPLF